MVTNFLIQAVCDKWSHNMISGFLPRLRRIFSLKYNSRQVKESEKDLQGGYITKTRF